MRADAGRQRDRRQPRRLGLADAVERGGDAPLGGDDVGPALEELGGQPGRHRVGLRRAAARVTRGCGRRVAAEQDLQRADGLFARQLDLAQRVAVGADVDARATKTSSSLPTPTRDRVSASRTSSSLSRMVRARDLGLQAGLGGQEPALGDERGDRLARVLEVGLRRRGVGRGRGAAVSHAAPEVELPRHRERRALQARAVARHLAAAAREQVDRRIELGAGELGVEQRLLDARRADAQVGVVGDGFGDGGGQLIVVERGEPVVRARRRHPRPPPSTAPAPCTVGSASSLIAAVSGGFFSTHAERHDRAASPAASTDPRRQARARCTRTSRGSSMHELTSVTQADAVLDDDVVEVRRHPQQHLADDVHQREMLGVDRRRPARAGGEEQRADPACRRRA